MENCAPKPTDKISDELLEAVKSGEAKRLEDALRVKNVNVYAIDENGHNIMHHAAVIGNLESVKLLLNLNCSFGKRDFEGRTALFLACSKATSLSVIQALLYNPENHVNVCDKKNVSPLMAACLYSTPPVVEALIQCGADLDIEDTDGMFASWYAQESNDLQKYSLIISALVCNEYEIISRMRTLKPNGVPKLPFQKRIWFRDDFGWSFLHWSVVQNSIECLDIALKIGCDPLQRDILLRSPLHLACHFGAGLEVVERFFNELLDVVNEPDSAGVTPLMAACRVSTVEVVEALLQVGAKVTLVDLHERSALWYAKYYNRMDLFTLLMQYGAIPVYTNNLDFTPINLKSGLDAINDYGEDGYTPLMRAVRDEDIKTIKKLLKEGARTDILDKDNRTVLWHAFSKDREDICMMLCQAGADPTLVLPNVLYCTRKGDLEELETAIEEGIGLNAVDSWGNNALHIACMRQDLFSVRLLLNAGVSTKARNKWGATPLFMACISEVNLKIISELIKFDKESVNICTYNLNSPLIAACKFCNLDVVSFLIESKADINHDNVEGHTPLLYAYSSGNHDTYQLLLSNGANPVKGGDCLLPFYIEYILARWNVSNELVTSLLRKNLESVKLSGDVNLIINEQMFPFYVSLKNMENFVKLLVELNQTVHFVDSDVVKFPRPDVLTLRICAYPCEVLTWLCSQSAAIDPDKSLRRNVVYDLKHLSRRVVRRSLAENARCEADFREVLEDTLLPKLLQDYIRYL